MHVFSCLRLADGTVETGIAAALEAIDAVNNEQGRCNVPPLYGGVNAFTT